MPNKGLHWMEIPLRSIPTSELCRYERNYKIIVKRQKNQRMSRGITSLLAEQKRTNRHARNVDLSESHTVAVQVQSPGL